MLSDLFVFSSKEKIFSLVNMLAFGKNHVHLHSNDNDVWLIGGIP